MNRNQYCCQRCGNLKYDWSGNLCPECLEKDRLRKEGKGYFGMPIKMREATKEEKQGVNEYIQSISEKVYTKEEVIAILTELQTEIERQCKIPNNCASAYDWNNGVYACYKAVQGKIDKLKGGNGYAE